MYKDNWKEKILYSGFAYHLRKIYPLNILRKRFRKAYDLDHVSCIKQRLKLGVSKSDAWSLDNYLAKVIAQGVKFVKEDAHGGMPCKVYDENNKLIHEYDWSDNPEDHDHNKDFAIWENVLDQIIEGFEQYDIMIYEFEWIEDKKEIKEYSKEEIAELERKFDIAFKLLHNNFSGLWT